MNHGGRERDRLKEESPSTPRREYERSVAEQLPACQGEDIKRHRLSRGGGQMPGVGPYLAPAVLRTPGAWKPYVHYVNCEGQRSAGLVVFAVGTQAPTARPLAPVMSVLGGNALAVALAASVLRGT